MGRLDEAILRKTNELSEGTPVYAKMFLHLGTRSAVGKSLARLTRTGSVLRVERGIYVSPVKSRFGTHPPSVHRLVAEFAIQRGETIVASGAMTANALGLTTQVPVQMLYWTSGRSRKLNLGKLVLGLEHVASWQLVLAKEPAGEIVRALAWAGPERVHTVLKEIESKVPRTDVIKVAQQASRFPRWLADALSRSAGSARQ